MKLKPACSAEVQSKLNNAVAGVEAALQDWAQNPLTYTTEAQLTDLREKLLKMLDGIEQGSSRDIPGMWRVLVDTWPYTSQLRQMIVEAELSYERLK